jgi:hypothetical protein
MHTDAGSTRKAKRTERVRIHQKNFVQKSVRDANSDSMADRRFEA